MPGYCIILSGRGKRHQQPGWRESGLDLRNPIRDGQVRRPSAKMDYGHRLPNSLSANALPQRCDTRNWVNDAKTTRRVLPQGPAVTPQPLLRIAHNEFTLS
jgi:hypothetical protein